MVSPLFEKAAYSAFVVLLGLLVKFVYKLIRPWIKTRKEMAADKARKTNKEIAEEKARTRQQIARIFAVLVFACSVAFALLFFQAVTLPPTSPETPVVRLLTGGAGALCVMGALLMIFGLPAYNCVIDLDDRCRSLEVHNQKLEERLKAVEQGQSQNGEQLPQQRNLAFMEMWSVQKRDNDPDLMKKAKA